MKTLLEATRKKASKKGSRFFRAVGRSENPGVPVLFGGNNLPPLVDTGLTDLQKSGGAMATPAPPETTGLKKNN